MSVQFAKYTEAEALAADEIVSKAYYMFKRNGMRKSRLEISMDLAATHHSCPLMLEDLAGADDFNFSHDVIGIHRHLNRSTGMLDNSFLPRFADLSKK